MEINCTQCGSKIKIAPDTLFTVCPYCDSSLLVEFSGTYRHLLMFPLLSEKNLSSVLGKELAKIELTKKPEITNIKLIYLPYFKVKLEKGEELVIPAYSPELEALEQLKLPEGELNFFQPQKIQKGELREPELLFEDLSLKLKSEFSLELETAELIHIPFYFVDYNYLGRSYKAGIEAISGKLYADLLPPSVSSKKNRMFFLWMIATIALFVLEAIIIPGFWLVLVGYAFSGGAIYYILKKELEKRGW